MAEDDTRSGSRAFRFVGGSLAALAGLALVAALCAAGGVFWFFHSLSRHPHQLHDASLAAARSAADKHQAELVTAAADGTLSDREISQMLGRLWVIERSPGRWEVTERQSLSDGYVCFRFDVPVPLGPRIQVTHAELPSCPTMDQHLESSLPTSGRLVMG